MSNRLRNQLHGDGLLLYDAVVKSKLDQGQIMDKMGITSKQTLYNHYWKAEIDDETKTLWAKALGTAKEQIFGIKSNSHENSPMREAIENPITEGFSKTQRGVMIVLGLSYSTSLRDPQIIQELDATRDIRLDFLYKEIDGLIAREKAGTNSGSANPTPDEKPAVTHKVSERLPLKGSYRKEDIEKNNQVPKEDGHKLSG